MQSSMRTYLRACVGACVRMRASFKHRTAHEGGSLCRKECNSGWGQEQWERLFVCIRFRKAYPESGEFMLDSIRSLTEQVSCATPSALEGSRHWNRDVKTISAGKARSALGIYIYIYIYIYVYVYREIDRERERNSYRYICIYIYIYVYPRSFPLGTVQQAAR